MSADFLSFSSSCVSTFSLSMTSFVFFFSFSIHSSVSHSFIFIHLICLCIFLPILFKPLLFFVLSPFFHFSLYFIQISLSIFMHTSPFHFSLSSTPFPSTFLFCFIFLLHQHLFHPYLFHSLLVSLHLIQSITLFHVTN